MKNRTINLVDPFFIILHWTLKEFFETGLRKEEIYFVEKNIDKHRKILWLNLIAGILVYLGINNSPVESINVIITSLLAPVMVMGGAWFSVSFGGVPTKLINLAMSVTFWMFSAFTISLSAMFIAIGFVTNPYFWPVLGVIYFGTFISCIKYDTTDGLKSGLDEALLKHSKAALIFYKEREGINLDES